MIFWQYLIPKHFLSKLMFKFTRIQNRWVYKKFTLWIINTYGVNVSEAKEENIDNYKCFNDFFTRELKTNARPIGEGFISPTDGVISQSGEIIDDTLIQAKGKNYTLDGLLGNTKNTFQHFATIYLSPKDYHRIHAPLNGKLLKMQYIGGNLFSVNTQTVAKVDNLFARNERVVCYFDTFTIVLVGAIFVGSMETVWHGQITPPYGKNFSVEYADKNITLNKGDELGRFNMGSTVILLSNTHTLDFTENTAVKMGETLIPNGKN